jgi:hypothetical protein
MAVENPHNNFQLHAQAQAPAQAPRSQAPRSTLHAQAQARWAMGDGQWAIEI